MKAVAVDQTALSGRALLAFATLAAFLFQIFLTDTHWHWSELGVGPSLGVPASSTSVVKDAATHSPSGDVCQICQALASAGRALGGSVASLAAPASVARRAQTPEAPATALRPVSFHWRGARAAIDRPPELARGGTISFLIPT